MSKNTLRFPENAIASGRFGTARVRSEIAGAAARLASVEPVLLESPIKQLVSKVHGPRTKYGNRKEIVDGITFDSEREAARYRVLAARHKAGEITNLKIQVPFVIVPGTTIAGKKLRARLYIADFVYEMPRGTVIVEDVKGMRTPMYLLKRHLMKVVHNIEIQEI